MIFTKSRSPGFYWNIPNLRLIWPVAGEGAMFPTLFNGCRRAETAKAHSEVWHRVKLYKANQTKRAHKESAEIITWFLQKTWSRCSQALTSSSFSSFKDRRSGTLVAYFPKTLTMNPLLLATLLVRSVDTCFQHRLQRTWRWHIQRCFGGSRSYGFFELPRLSSSSPPVSRQMPRLWSVPLLV